jgi:tetratricopeptide (TPR) repeat protein
MIWGPPSGRLSRLAPYGILIAAVFLAYANVYGNAFLLDDEMLIQKNAYLRNWGDLWLLVSRSSTAGFGGTDYFWRPLQGLTYFLIFQGFGETPAPFHFFNVALHAANSCLVLGLGKRLGFSPAVSFVAALLWAVHPVHTEAITYISATADPLYVFFSLAGLIALFPRPSPRHLVFSAFFFALALLSKETAVLFPLLAVLCLFYREGRLSLTSIRAPLFFYFIVLTVYLLCRSAVVGLEGNSFYQAPNLYSESIWIRSLTFLATIPSYVGLLIWPDDLHMERNFPVHIDPWDFSVLTGFAVALIALCLIVRWARTGKNSGLGFGFAWFFIAHALHSGVFLAVNSIFYEHWLYFPTVGLVLGGTGRLSECLKSKKESDLRLLSISIVVFATLCLSLLTLEQNRVWRSPIAFYENILSYNDKSATVFNNLGMAYADTGEHGRAIDSYRAAIAISDTYPQTHHNLGLSLAKKAANRDGLLQAAAEFEKAIGMNPRFYQSYFALADVYSVLGDQAKTAEYRNKGALLQNQALHPSN